MKGLLGLGQPLKVFGVRCLLSLRTKILKGIMQLWCEPGRKLLDT